MILHREPTKLEIINWISGTCIKKITNLELDELWVMEDDELGRLLASLLIDNGGCVSGLEKMER